VVVSRCAAALLLLVLAGCGRGEAAGPENVEVSVGAEQVAVRPTQYCLDGDGQRYSTTPPIIEVSPDSPISLTVPESVAEQGWSVQVFDEKLEEPIGEVDVPEGESVLDEINTSDVVPPAFYLVVVEDKGGDCGEFSGAWPVGFLRAGGDLSGTPSSSAPPAG
jgi:glucose/arabinose dehydrogenase